MTTAQKIGIAFALFIVVAFLAYTGYRDNGLRALRQRLTTTFTNTPAPATGTPSASLSFETGVEVIVSSPTPSVPSAPKSSVTVPAPATILDAINARRSSAGVGVLATNRTLASVAQRHADDMAARNYFSHTDPDGVTFQQRIAVSGYGGSATAENLALTSGPAVSVVASWMDSEAHRSNMLNSQYVAVGIGTSSGTWQGMSVVFVVAVFGNAK